MGRWREGGTDSIWRLLLRSDSRASVNVRFA